MLHLCVVCCTATRAPDGPSAADELRAAYFSEADLARVGHQPLWIRPVRSVPFRLRVDGPIVGRVRAGTELSVFTSDEFPGWFLADLQLPTAHGERFVLRNPETMMGVFLPMAASSADQRQLRRNVNRSATSLLHGLHRELSAEPGGPPFALVRCHPAKVLERQGGYAHLAVEGPAVELWGWIESPTQNRVDAACRGTSSLPEDEGCGVAPHGYQTVRDRSKEFVALAQKRTPIYWADAWAPARTCRAWRFGGGTESPTYLTLDELPQNLAELRVSVSIDAGAGALSLTNAALTHTNGQLLVVGGGSTYTLVGLDAERIDFVGWSGSLFNPGNRVCSYRADSTYRWYMSREACERGGGKDVEY